MQWMKKEFSMQQPEAWAKLDDLAILRGATATELVKRGKGSQKGKGMNVLHIVHRATEVILGARPALMRALFWQKRQRMLSGQHPEVWLQGALRAAIDYVRKKAREPALGGDWMKDEWHAGIDEVHTELVAKGVREER